MGIDVEQVRKDFPVLSRQVNGYPLSYLDSANTSQKPRQVIDAVANFFATSNANVARALHQLGEEATEAYEGARVKVADFIGAAGPQEVIFTKNASEALNMAASTLGQGLKPGDEVVISMMEHHSNLVSWQLACQRFGATLRWFELTNDGMLDIDKAREDHLINDRTKVVALTWVSNVLGTINPIREIADWAHQVGATMVVDGSQGVPHQPTDVVALGADMLAFTGHKMCAPTGVGVLWGRYDLLESLPPFLGGGEMIEVVKMERSTYAPPPARFEAGTPPIGQAFGLGVAIDYLQNLGMDAIADTEHHLTKYLYEKVSSIAGVTVLGPKDPAQRGPLVAFSVDGVHPHDVMQLLDSRGVAIRGGHHCAAPLHARFCLSASNRASGYFYTTTDEVDRLADALVYTRDFFAGKFKGK